jgi:hypothetical protein
MGGWNRITQPYILVIYGLSDATAILLQLVLGNWANFQLQVSHAIENQLHKTIAKWQISSSGNTLQYAHTRGGSYKPKVRQFDVSDFVCLQQQPNDTLDTSFGCTILKIKAIKPSSVLELQGVDECTIQDHSKNCVPYHLSNLNPTIIALTWIPPLDYPCHVC